MRRIEKVEEEEEEDEEEDEEEEEEEEEEDGKVHSALLQTGAQLLQDLCASSVQVSLGSNLEMSRIVTPTRHDDLCQICLPDVITSPLFFSHII